MQGTGESCPPQVPGQSTDRRVRCDEVETVERPRIHVQFGGNAGSEEPTGELDALVSEGLYFAHVDQRGRQTGQVGGASRAA